MSWVAVGTAVVGGAIQYKGQKDATKAQQKGYSQAQAANDQALAQTRQDMSPYMALGTTGANGLNRLLADPNSIANSSAYQFRLGQGLQAQDRSAASRGGLFGGGHSADLMQFGQGLASQEYDNEWNRNLGLTQLGQNTATGLGNLAQGHAASQGNLALGSAESRASGYQNQANTLGQLAYGIGGTANDWWQNRKAATAPGYNFAQPQSAWGQQASTGAGSIYNFGNNPGWKV